MFRGWRLVPDELIPGTLNVGHVLPTVVQAVIYMTIVAGRLHDAGPAAGGGLPPARGSAPASSPACRAAPCRWRMGSALFLAAGIMLLQLLGLVPGGGTALGLTGAKLAIGVGVNFVLGALMTLGIGLYAPCMIMISLLGMDPKAAFPIMMGSCAFLMPVGGIKFIRKDSVPPARRRRPGARRAARRARRGVHREGAADPLHALAGRRSSWSTRPRR